MIYYAFFTRAKAIVVVLDMELCKGTFLECDVACVFVSEPLWLIHIGVPYCDAKGAMKLGNLLPRTPFTLTLDSVRGREKGVCAAGYSDAEW